MPEVFLDLAESDVSREVDDIDAFLKAGGILPSAPELYSRASKKTQTSVDAESPSELRSGFDQFRQSITQTLYFLRLFFPIKLNDVPLSRAASRWYSMCSAAGADDFMIQVCDLYRTPEQVSLQMMFMALDAACLCTALKGCAGPLPNLSAASSYPDVPRISHMFLLHCFSRDYHADLAITALLQMMGDAVQMEVDEHRLLCLLRVTRQALELHGFDQDELASCLYVCKLYVLYPGLYGREALVLANTILNEMRAPGYAMRLRLAREFTNLGADDVTDYRGRDIPAFFFESSRPSLHLMRTLQITNDIVKENTQLDDQSLTLKLKRRLLTFALKEECSIMTDLGLSMRVPAAVINSQYDVLVSTMKQCLSLSDEEAAKKRKEKLTEIKATIEREASKGTGPPPIPLTSNPAPHVPEPRTSIYEVVRDELTLCNIIDDKYPHTDFARKLTAWLSTLPTPSLSAGRQLLRRVALFGGDDLIAQAANAYAVLAETQHTCVKNRQLEFAIIPVTSDPTQNTLANFIAAYDGWYFQHLYSQVTATVTQLFPHAREGLRRDKALVPAPLSSRDVSRGSVMEYLRSAHESISLNMYKVKCWPDFRKYPDRYRTLAMVMHIDIGIAAYSKSFVQKFASSRVADEDFTSRKDFKFTPPNLIMSYLPVSISGKVGSRSSVASRLYHRLTLSNIPRLDDRMPGVNPVDPSLALFLEEFQKASEEPVQKRLYIQACEIAAGDASSFELAVDGVLHGSFSKISDSVEPLKPSWSTDAITFPVVSFLKTDL